MPYALLFSPFFHYAMPSHVSPFSYNEAENGPQNRIATPPCRHDAGAMLRFHCCYVDADAAFDAAMLLRLHAAAAIFSADILLLFR